VRALFGELGEEIFVDAAEHIAHAVRSPSESNIRIISSSTLPSMRA
jgi:hypothetical protein